jgi:hypothetical protein
MSILATNMAATLRSLTKSPITSALDQARRMAKQHLNAGGGVADAVGGGDEGVVLPANIDTGAITAAISAALGARSGRPRGQPSSDMLVQRRDGRLVVRLDYIERLGDGDLARGERILVRLIDDQRRRGSAR